MDVAWFRFRKWAGQFMPLFSSDGVVWAQFDAGIALDNFFTGEPDRWGFMIQPLNNVTPAVPQRMDVFDWSEEPDTDVYPQFANLKNADGEGDRTARITVTTDATLTDGTIDRLVDGGFGSSIATACAWASGQSGRQVTFQFTEPKIITEARWFRHLTVGGPGHGQWKWQGSHNGTTFLDLTSSFTLDGNSNDGFVIGDLLGNTTAHAYYRLQQVSGSTSNGPWLREIAFKLRKG